MDSFGNWMAVPNSGWLTRSYTVPNLTNEHGTTHSRCVRRTMRGQGRGGKRERDAVHVRNRPPGAVRVSAHKRR